MASCWLDESNRETTSCHAGPTHAGIGGPSAAAKPIFRIMKAVELLCGLGVCFVVVGVAFLWLIAALVWWGGIRPGPNPNRGWEGLQKDQGL